MTVYVKPAPGMQIRDPERRDRLPADQWRPVPYSTYWGRMAQAGDISLSHEKPEGAIEGEDAELPPPEAVTETRRVPRRAGEQTPETGETL